MNLIDQYVNTVTTYLPEKDREIAEKQLCEKIDMRLPVNPTDADIQNVLEQLGNPGLLANEYRQDKQYLIGPDLYYSYLSVLKVVIPVIAILSAVGSMLAAIWQTPIDNGIVEFQMDLFATIFSSIFEGAAQAFLWVTLIYFILQKRGVKAKSIPIFKQKWSVTDLSKLPPSSKAKIPRMESAIALFFSVFFTSLLYFRPEIFGLYTASRGSLILEESFFVLEQLQSYMVLIIVLAVVQLGILIYKFITKQWTLPLAIVNTAYNAAICVLVSVMVADHSLFNLAFFTNLFDLLNISGSQLTSIWWGLKVFSVFFIIGCSIDSVVGFIKCKRQNRILGNFHFN
ncbi:MAG: hypothetical protein K6T88_00020 [Bacillus sp. (in: Bacteria)]|nr:hypothetical protein [Bacillus sp. (in: firmicutes)]